MQLAKCDDAFAFDNHIVQQNVETFKVLWQNEIQT